LREPARQSEYRAQISKEPLALAAYHAILMFALARFSSAARSMGRKVRACDGTRASGHKTRKPSAAFVIARDVVIFAACMLTAVRLRLRGARGKRKRGSRAPVQTADVAVFEQVQQPPTPGRRCPPRRTRRFFCAGRDAAADAGADPSRHRERGFFPRLSGVDTGAGAY
jgi:hypothetical protein